MALWIKEKNEDLWQPEAASQQRQVSKQVINPLLNKVSGAFWSTIWSCMHFPMCLTPPENKSYAVIRSHLYFLDLTSFRSFRRRLVSGRAPSGRCWRNPNATIGASRATPSEGPRGYPRTVDLFLGLCGEE